MGSTPAPSAASAYAPAQAAIGNAYSSAQNLAAESPPKTYQFDPYQANNEAALLSRTQVQQNQQALAARSPQAAAGQTAAINALSGGTAGDDQFLQNAALKAGLEKGVSGGTIGPGSVTTPSSVGATTTANIFGSDLLNYRNQRAQQALGVASALQPDAAVAPGDALSAIIGGQQQAVTNQNDWNSVLANMRMGQVSNLQNMTQQQEGAQQGVLNANANASNASKQAAIAAGASLAAAAAGAAIL